MFQTPQRKTARHRFHGDAARFSVLADFILSHYGSSVRYLADVAGGQGMLARVLTKRGYTCEVIDPRGWVLKGVVNRTAPFDVNMTDYYDLIVALHPDAALPEVVRAAEIRPTLLVPCCNFLSQTKLGRDALLEVIEMDYQRRGISFDRFILSFDGPHNIALVSEPPRQPYRLPNGQSLPVHAVAT